MSSPIDARMLVQTLRLPIMILDREDVVVAANTAAIAAFVDRAINPVRKNFKDVVADSVRAPLARLVGDAKRQGRAAAGPAGPATATDRVLANVRVEPLRDEAGAIAGVAIIVDDGTDDSLLSVELQTVNEELQTSNEELQAANEEVAARLDQLQQAHRLDDERNRFLAMLAHELRNPLAGIKSALYLLRRWRNGTAVDRVAEQALRIAERQVQNQTRLLDDLLDVSRIVLGKITLRVEPTDLAAVVRHALDAADFAVRARAHTVRYELPDEPVVVMGDPVRLEQIAANLVNNAIKYTPPAGEIVVIVSSTPETATLIVRDAGVGMEPTLLARVFDPFTQGDATLARAAGGLGIGLTVVRQLVELHGGTIEARSPGPRAGSTFEVRLPRINAPIVASAAAPKPTMQPKRGARRVLVVDDNRDARAMLRMVLELDGHHVQDAGDAANAVRVAVESLPEVALIDIGLPGVDGYEVARRIRKRLGRSVRLVALTGYSDSEARRLAVEAGFDDYLVKPVDPDRLGDVVAAG